MEAIAHFLAHLKDSSPGPDGIPYSCYEAHLSFSASIFFWATLVLLSGRILYLICNCQRACFVPKNRPIEGSAPNAEELRSLGLKNTDNKAIIGATFREVSQVVSSCAVSLQRGFVQSRQATLNIVDLDATTRAHANFNHFNNESVLALWDFLAAFPSVRHKWIILVFTSYGFPRGFINFLDGLFFF